jgi:hypothetical protein
MAEYAEVESLVENSLDLSSVWSILRHEGISRINFPSDKRKEYEQWKPCTKVHNKNFPFNVASFISLYKEIVATTKKVYSQ